MVFLKVLSTPTSVTCAGQLPHPDEQSGNFALVKPNIMAKKMMRANRGTDPKRPAEPRRAERRHDREAAREHIDMTLRPIVK